VYSASAVVKKVEDEKYYPYLLTQMTDWYKNRIEQKLKKSTNDESNELEEAFADLHASIQGKEKEEVMARGRG